jgi:hypothetical protein
MSEYVCRDHELDEINDLILKWSPVSSSSKCTYKLVDCPLCKITQNRDTYDHEDYIDELDEQCRLMTSHTDIAYETLHTELQKLPSWKEIPNQLINHLHRFLIQLQNNETNIWSHIFPTNETNGSHFAIFTHEINIFKNNNYDISQQSFTPSSVINNNKVNLLLELQLYTPMNDDFAIHVPPHQFIQHICQIDKRIKSEETNIFLSFGETTITYLDERKEDNFTIGFCMPFLNRHIIHSSDELLPEFISELNKYFQLVLYESSKY